MGPPQKCILILILALISDLSLAACPKQSLLEDLLSPANAERALQILKLASVGANAINPIGNTLLDGIAPRFAPAMPNIVAAKQFVSDFYQRRVPRPIAKPIVEILPELPCQYPPVVAPNAVIQEKVFPGVPIPTPCVSPSGPVPAPAVPIAPAVPVAYPPPPAPCPAAPVPLVNPFLPAASPVSALAPPTSSLLPPVIPTQVRSNFLRKIPIPPPCL